MESAARAVTTKPFCSQLHSTSQYLHTFPIDLLAPATLGKAHVLNFRDICRSSRTQLFPSLIANWKGWKKVKKKNNGQGNSSLIANYLIIKESRPKLTNCSQISHPYPCQPLIYVHPEQLPGSNPQHSQN